MTAEEPPGGHGVRLAETAQTPVTPPTDTPNVSQLLVPPDDTTWRNEHIPEPLLHRREEGEAGDGRNPLMRTRRRPGPVVLRGGAATGGRGGRSTCLPSGASPAGGRHREILPGRFDDEAATAYAVVGKHGPGYDGDYDDEVDDGSQWQQGEVDNEKAEPASIDGEYGGGAFSSYNRVHVAVSPIKADPMTVWVERADE